MKTENIIMYDENRNSICLAGVHDLIQEAIIDVDIETGDIKNVTLTEEERFGEYLDDIIRYTYRKRTRTHFPY